MTAKLRAYDKLNFVDIKLLNLQRTVNIITFLTLGI